MAELVGDDRADVANLYRLLRHLEFAHATSATVHLVRGDHDVAVRAPARFLPALVEACRSVARAAHGDAATSSQLK